MVRPFSLAAALSAGFALTACADNPKPTQSFIDVADVPPLFAPRVEQGRILDVRQTEGPSFTYTVERIRDESVIEVAQPDARPLPAGLRVFITYGPPTTIEAAPATPDSY